MVELDIDRLVAANISRLRAGMRGAGLDALLLTRVDNFAYVTGLKVLDIKWYMHRQAAIVTQDALLCMPALPDEEAARASGRYTGVMGLPLAHEAWPEQIARALAELGVSGKRIGYDPSTPYPVIAGLTRLGVGSLADAGSVVAAARAVKSGYEIAAIRQGLAVVEEALRDAFMALRPGLAETELSARITGVVLARGADGIGFPPIVSSGLNFSIPLRYATEKRIQSGELVNFCTAAHKSGYYAELHRMSATSPPEGEQREMYGVVYEALQNGIQAIAPGRPLQGLDQALRATVRKAGYEPYEQKHVTAHGMGCNVLDFPLIGDPGGPAAGSFEPGMVVHVVSGIFKPGVCGCRVSEMVAVTRDGHDVLSRLEHPYLETP